MRLLLIVVAVSGGQLAFGYSAAPPESFAKATADGKHVLVMLQTKPAGDLREPNPVEMRYAKSGLYLANVPPKPGGNDPVNPVWTCDWSADWARSVLAAADTVHVVRVPDVETGLRHWLLGIEGKRANVPPKPANLESQPAVFLYQNGKLFKTLTFGEVFDCSIFTAADCFMGPVVVLEQLDDAGGRVHLHAESERGSQYAAIDFRTGQVVIAGKAPPPPDKCGNEGPSPVFFGFDFGGGGNGGSDDTRSRLGYALLALVVAAATIGGVLAVVTIWRKPRDADAR